MNRRLQKQGRNLHATGHRVTITYLLLATILYLLPEVVISADNSTTDVDNARTILEKWVETRRIISQEKRDWALAQEVLNERIDLVQREIESMRGKIGEAKTNIAEVEKNQAGLIEENEKLEEASTVLNHAVRALEAQTAALLKRLPDPILMRVKPLSQRLPENPEETELSLAERFQNVIGILNEVNKFNREITLTSEVRELPGGPSVEVTALYVGIGQAYYVSANGSVAGVGTASSEGWVWQPANDAAKQIANAIAILKNEQVASFVKLPVDIP